MMMEISRKRKIVNAVMLSISGICTVLVIGVLFFILGYLLWHGGRSLDLDFFTKLPKPSGETGGGMANAIVGSGKVLLISTLIGVPLGFLAGVYLAEYSGQAFAFLVRYTVDLLNGVPSIVIGIVAYALVVRPMKHF
jgi:phosphate transport system permease protein